MRKTTDNVIFNYDVDDSFLIDELSTFINDNKNRICNFFNIDIDNYKPIINIISKKEELDNIYRKDNSLNITDDVPKWLIGLKSSNMEIYYLSINDYNNTTHAFKKEDYAIHFDMYKKTLLHEYIHYINHMFCKKNNCQYSIKCLSEGIAQYLSNQNNNTKFDFNYNLEDIINSNNCYEGWYLVTKYIIENYTHEFFLELLKNKDDAEQFIRNSYKEIENYYLNLKVSKLNK